jgi:N-acetylglucosamine-6-phosphate deacetylase
MEPDAKSIFHHIKLPMSRYRLTNARLPRHNSQNDKSSQDLWIEDGKIIAIVPSIQEFTDAPPIKLDLDGDWLSLGGMDLQINGALGLAFPDVTIDSGEKIIEINQFLWDHGVDAYCPTIVTAAVSQIQTALAGFKSQCNPPQCNPRSNPIQPNQATIAGIHLEGPFLNPAKRGAHPKEHILPLTIDNLKRVLGDYASLVKIITLAPEMEAETGAIEYLKSLDITVSLGHSLATAEQANHAFIRGATMVTHAFNAMSSLHYRTPGLLGSAIVNPNVTCGFIADGQHIAPLMIDILLRASDYDRGLFLVSDALSPLGLPDGHYPWDSRTIEVRQGTARLPDGTLSGTTLGLLVGVQNLMKWGLCNLEQAIAMATITPRIAIHADSNIKTAQGRLFRWSKHQPGTWQQIIL